MSERIADQNTLALTDQELDFLRKVLGSGDRAGFYLSYAEMTGSYEALLQSKVSTFSDIIGGIAFASNRVLQDKYGAVGADTIDGAMYPGIYYISQLVAESALNAINTNIVEKHESGLISDNAFFVSAGVAWKKLGLIDLFPGHGLNVFPGSGYDLSAPPLEYKGSSFGTPGFAAGGNGAIYADYAGKQLSDFSGAGYRIVPTQFGNVVLDRDGHVVASFVDAGSGDALAFTSFALAKLAKAAILSSAPEVFWSGLYDVMHVGSETQGSTPDDPMYAAARRGFTESNPGYNGDVGGQSVPMIR